jgi:hypothetical protein
MKVECFFRFRLGDEKVASKVMPVGHSQRRSTGLALLKGSGCGMNSQAFFGTFWVGHVRT